MKSIIRNQDIRSEIEQSKLPHWFIAEQLGVSAVTFSCWLRRELPEETKHLIRNVIKNLEGGSKC